MLTHHTSANARAITSTALKPEQGQQGATEEKAHPFQGILRAGEGVPPTCRADPWPPGTSNLMELLCSSC